jgi:hypothetical protein
MEHIGRPARVLIGVGHNNASVCRMSW